ncbi:response regulator [Mucilaginibacter sabulilitoris]|uniref:Response regulator n=1 Tax=Mucilaginibacter sabulilitoris TaxID=1173583 RepID=A0ABZ0TVG7_9SPHI|nr:response regulator [Mucilaginibacter sabulilitoris]WPU97091.1 response regulator [Mucilaginibacter sabulilitoris]
MSRKLVYILEDDPDISELIVYILSEAGYEPVECGTVDSFNEIISHKLPDIFILDIILPDGNGLDVCKQLSSNITTSGIPVLMMSANKTRREIEDFGCKADFISKPFNIEHLLERIDSYA